MVLVSFSFVFVVCVLSVLPVFLFCWVVLFWGLAVLALGPAFRRLLSREAGLGIPPSFHRGSGRRSRAEGGRHAAADPRSAAVDLSEARRLDGRSSDQLQRPRPERRHQTRRSQPQGHLRTLRASAVKQITMADSLGPAQEVRASMLCSRPPRSGNHRRGAEDAETKIRRVVLDSRGPLCALRASAVQPS